ncbi:MAG: DUF6285 domain-containing protein [Phototrophicaceae bacterium]
MYDRPTLTELLSASIQHFEEKVKPVTKTINAQLYFQTLVAINVLRIAKQEYAMRPYHLRAEWTRLNMVIGKDLKPIDNDDDLEVAIQAANIKLCERIRQGEFDDDYALFQHLIARTTEQLDVANPKFLQAIRLEEKQQTDD